MKLLAKFFLSLLFFAGSAGANAQTTVESRKLASEVPIADVHMHLTEGLTPERLRAQMDANNVRWGGAVGHIAPGLPPIAVYASALGERYIPAGGQGEFMRIFYQSGAEATTNPKHPIFRGLAKEADAQFKAGTLRGFGELFANNRRSHPNPKFRRKVATDAPTFRELYAIAARNNGFLQIHLEADDDSLAQLDRLIASAGPAVVILSHCMMTAPVATVRRVLEKHKTVYCELSARGAPTLVEKHPMAKLVRIHDSRGIDGTWLKLIEEMPDRFMIGSDNISYSYDEIIRSYRTNFLPHLKPETLRKAAYENAQRVLQLK